MLLSNDFGSWSVVCTRFVCFLDLVIIIVASYRWRLDLIIICFSLQDGQGPFISLMMVYIFSAMTNLAIDIRLMAFKFLDLVLQNCPTSFSLYAEKVPILPSVSCNGNVVVLYMWTMLCDCLCWFFTWAWEFFC